MTAEIQPETPPEEAPNPLFSPEPDELEAESAFDAAEEGDGEAEEAPVEASEDAEAEPAAKSEMPPGLKRRLAQMARQKRDARRDADKARLAADEAKAKLDAVTPFEAAVREHYGRFKDPLREMAMDAKRMDALESMKDVPEVQRVIALLERTIQKGNPVSQTPEKPQTPASPPAEAAIPAPVAALLRQTATDKIEAALGKVGVRPAFKGIMRDHVLAEAGDKAVGLSEAEILRHAKGYVEKYGLAESDVVEKPQAPAAKRPATPKSDGMGFARQAAPKGKAAAAPAEKGAPKTLSAWEQGHATRRAALLESL
jgi:hypothetical protein